MSEVDVVVVAYNSSGVLRACVEPLTSSDRLHVIVVDNASTDGSLESVADLKLEAIGLETNGGFAHGCNAGWRAGGAPYVLFLNPDARIEPQAIEGLVALLERSPRAGAAAPRIIHDDGSLDYSQRRFPRLRSTYAQALFLHRLFPKAPWADELIRDGAAYERPGSPDWVSGACILIRRSALLELGGLDDGFFMYCEDIDLCRRLRDAGHDVLFDPSAEIVHVGGASAPRASLLPVLAASRLRYAAKHRSRSTAMLERVGIALGEATHLLVGRGGRAARAGHARALGHALSRPGTESYPFG